MASQNPSGHVRIKSNESELCGRTSFREDAMDLHYTIIGLLLFGPWLVVGVEAVGAWVDRHRPRSVRMK